MTQKPLETKKESWIGDQITWLVGEVWNCVGNNIYIEILVEETSSVGVKFKELENIKYY